MEHTCGRVMQWLEDPDLGRLTLCEHYGYMVRELDLGFPVPRTVVAPRINASGTSDRTALHAERAVVMSVDCFVPAGDGLSRRVVTERLRAYAAPGRRPVFSWSEDDGAQRRVVLRADSLTWPLARFGADVATGLSFVAPSGLLEDYAATTVVVGAVPAATGGRRYPVRYPRVYLSAAAAGIDGAGLVVNGDAWNAPTDHVTRLYGPCTGPRLVNVTTGQEISLPGLVLGAQQWAQVDTSAATIRLNDRAAESLYGWQQWGVSSFFQLAPGANFLRFAPQSYDDERARAEIVFRPATL